MNSPLIDEVFGDYRLTHLLGKGGMASVYRAVRSGPMGFAKEVAIKRLHSSLTRDGTILKALVNEARIGGQLKHPNIVEIYEFNRVGETYFLAMEFIDGWTLDRVLHLSRKYKQPLPMEVVLDMAIQICEGLHYAHTHESLDGAEVHLVHRDLKPANIILGRDGVTKIMDFGIAKADTNLFKTTMVDTTKGTPHYMSPEQVGGDPNLAATSDIFALGTLLYELATDEILFTGDSLAAVLFAVSRAEVNDEIDAVETAMPGLGKIVLRCLQREPADRYSTAKLLGEALVELRGSQGTGPWTTKNFMYTLRSKVLEESAEQAATAVDDDVEFAPFLGSGHGGAITHEMSAEETREAADAEISKLQSRYMTDALTETVAVDSIEPPIFEPVPASEELISQTVRTRKKSPNHTALFTMLGVALLLTLSVVALRIFGPHLGDASSEDGNTTTAAATDEPGAEEAEPGAGEVAGKSTASAGKKPVRTSLPAARKNPRRAPQKKTPAAVVSKPSPAASRTTAEAPPEQATLVAEPAAAEPAAAEPAAAEPAAAEAEPAAAEEATPKQPPAMGKLGVRGSTPSSTVFVDDRLVGKTPLMPIPLTEGKHSVRLHCATAGVEETKTITVTIEAGKTLKLGKYNFLTQQWK